MNSQTPRGTQLNYHHMFERTDYSSRC